MNPTANSTFGPVPNLDSLSNHQPWLLLDAERSEQVCGFLLLGAKRSLTLDSASSDAYAQISDFVGSAQGRCFGWIGYDQLRAHPLLDLPTQDPTAVQLPVAHWVEPQGVLSFCGLGPEAELEWLVKPHETWIQKAERAMTSALSIEPTKPARRTGTSLLDAPAYLAAFERVKQHIFRGNIYELNLCREITGRLDGDWSAAEGFKRLVEATSAPFSAWMKWNSVDILCASPERFLRREGDRLISQPIKGTAPRDTDPNRDRSIAEALRNDVKERAENVMITDLVRNDMSQVARKGSVHVEELCGVYSFRNVHQMISTVTCEVRPDAGFSDILHASFPMGSMTGAPKIRAMEITAEVEPVSRGLYSGTLGWAEPDGRGGVGDFDLNVVIRTALVDVAAKRWSVHVGGAITALATAQAEWTETQLKARAVLNALSASETSQSAATTEKATPPEHAR